MMGGHCPCSWSKSFLDETPCFSPRVGRKLYAEMTKEKNSLSHQYKAMDKLRSWLEILDAEQGDRS